MGDIVKQVVVLLTGAGAPGAPGIIKCLRKNDERDIRIIGVDMSENATGRKLVDAFYTVPAAKDDGFIGRVLEICLRERVDVVMPIVTRELMKFAMNRDCFSEIGTKIAVMAPEILDIVNNKAHLLTEMRKRGIRTPWFTVVHTADEVEKACYDMGYPERPVCVKGAEGNGSRGVRIVDAGKSMYDLLFNDKPNSLYISFHDLMLALREKPVPEMLVMEYLPGAEYGVDALCSNGKIIYMAGRSSYDVRSSIPQGCVIEKNDEAFAIAEEIIRKFGISGNLNFDFKYSSTGELQLMEINPRLSASIVAYAAAGVNFPYLGVKQVLGEEIKPQSITEGVFMQRRYSDVFFSPDGEELTW